MSTIIKTLTDGENQVLPRTVAKAVTTEAGETIENKLADLQTAVDGAITYTDTSIQAAILASWEASY